jgi:hypothetical protein
VILYRIITVGSKFSSEKVRIFQSLEDWRQYIDEHGVEYLVGRNRTGKDLNQTVKIFWDRTGDPSISDSLVNEEKIGYHDLRDKLRSLPNVGEIRAHEITMDYVDAKLVNEPTPLDIAVLAPALNTGGRFGPAGLGFRQGNAALLSCTSATMSTWSSLRQRRRRSNLTLRCCSML